LEFSIIYDVECEMDEDVEKYGPPWKQENLWEKTEEYIEEYDEGLWLKCAKWAAILSKEEFDEFIEHTGLYAEDVETSGSIGAPGFGYGWAPAISFRNEMPPYRGAYVTPIPKIKRKEGWDNKDWERIRNAVLRMYGY